MCIDADWTDSQFLFSIFNPEFVAVVSKAGFEYVA